MTALYAAWERMAVLSLILTVIAATAGFLAQGLYRDTAEMVRQAHATDLVSLVVASPLLAVGLWSSRRGSARGALLSMAMLAYLAYSYAIYAFSVVIDAMTPVHIAILGLAGWSLVLGTRLELDLQPSFGARLPARVTGGFLVLVAALFALTWLRSIGSAITSGTLPTSVSDLNLPTSPVFALDLAFALPLLAYIGVELARGRRNFRAFASAALAWLAVMGSSIVCIFAFDAAASVSVDASIAGVFAIVTALAAILAIVGFVPTLGEEGP